MRSLASFHAVAGAAAILFFSIIGCSSDSGSGSGIGGTGEANPDELFEPGPYEVGYREFPLTYPQAASGDDRELLLRVWYPAQDDSGAEPARYALSNEFIDLDLAAGNALDAPPVNDEGGFPFMPSEDVLAIATTYVENSGEPLLVEICTASDDAIQVWVNDQMITNVSECRGTASNCSELRPAVLPSGVSKIAVLVWQGIGGWGFRLGIRLGSTQLRDGEGPLEFLGPGFDEVGQSQYSLNRTAETEPFGIPNPGDVKKALICT